MLATQKLLQKGIETSNQERITERSKMASVPADITDDIQLYRSNNDTNNHDGDTTGQAQAIAAAGGSGTGSGTTNFNLWVEPNKIPEFFRS
jgi:hypothetical protein